MSVQLYLIVTQSVSLIVSSYLISVIQFTFQPIYIYRTCSEFSCPLFQFLCLTATFYNSFLLTRYVSFFLIFAALNTPSPISNSPLHTMHSHNCHLHSFDVGRSYSNQQRALWQQLKIVSCVFLHLLYILRLVLFSLYADFLHILTPPQIATNYISSHFYSTLACIIYIIGLI
jgi:hypothetical protein